MPAEKYYPLCVDCLNSWFQPEPEPAVKPERQFSYDIRCMKCPFQVFTKTTRTQMRLWQKAGIRCSHCGGLVLVEESLIGIMARS